jgi:hypothetical protein
MLYRKNDYKLHSLKLTKRRKCMEIVTIVEFQLKPIIRYR